MGPIKKDGEAIRNLKDQAVGALIEIKNSGTATAFCIEERPGAASDIRVGSSMYFQASFNFLNTAGYFVRKTTLWQGGSMISKLCSASWLTDKLARTILAAVLFIPGIAAVAIERQTVGWVERIRIGAQGFLVNAKLDTGADSSSLGAGDMDIYSRSEKFWVRFRITNDKKETARFDLPILRFVKIKRHGGKSIERPVIELDICLGRISKRTQVTLTDRSQFKFAALIGRNFLSAGKNVDSASKYLMEPNCQS